MSLLDSIDTKQLTLKSLKTNELYSFSIFDGNLRRLLVDAPTRSLASASTLLAGKYSASMITGERPVAVIVRSGFLEGCFLMMRWKFFS